LNKKLAAVAIAILMIVGFFPATSFAHPPQGGGWWTPGIGGTAGRQAPTCTDPAVPSTATDGAGICVFLHPGVEDAWKLGWSHTIGTVMGDSGDPGQVRQVFDKYLDYAILASSTASPGGSIGDLQFDIQVTSPTVAPPAGTVPPHAAPYGGIGIGGIRIYVPPEFTWLSTSPTAAVWSDITNDYQYIALSTRDAYDAAAPNWVRVSIGGDTVTSAPRIENGIYHIRFFNLRAPEQAGIFHFKIYYWDFAIADWLSVGPDNFPIIVVKGELNPAFAIVNVHALNYFSPPVPGTTIEHLSGWVLAQGTTPEGRAVEGVGYWSGEHGSPDWGYSGTDALGDWYTVPILGLAAGTYTITVEATGFMSTTSARFTLDPGQSFSIKIDINIGPSICVQVWSKHGTGAIPWHNLWQLPLGTNDPNVAPDDAGPPRDILLELYDSNGDLVAWYASRGATEENTIPVTTPSQTSYFVCLVDPDRLAVGYQITGTNWNGHIPNDLADFIAGVAQGQYTVEAYVTGYIMDEADAYQRTFVVSGFANTVQFDLRRSNWIDAVMHLENPLAAWTRSVVLTATDTGGSERAVVSFKLDGPQTDLVINGHDVYCAGRETTVAACALLNAPYTEPNPVYATATPNPAALDYAGGIVIEGYNNVWSGATPTGTPATQNTDAAIKDYGLNPTPSTHTMGAVTLNGNPYTVALYMSDMGQIYPTLAAVGTGWYWIVGPDGNVYAPQVSVFLCNSPVSLSFKIEVANVFISLRSVDFEVPAHSRPWTFPGSQIYVDFMDSSGNVVASVDPLLYGVFQDPGCGVNSPAGAATTATTGYLCPTAFDAAGHPVVPPIGFPIVGVDYLHLDPSLAFPDAPWLHGVGVTVWDIDNVNLPGRHEHLGVLWFGDDGYQGSAGADLTDELTDFPTRLNPGEYTFQAYTHGYIMRRSFPFQVPLTGHADIEADLIQGGQLRTCVAFLNENEPTGFSGFVRVEVLDSTGKLVGASIYGQAEPNPYTKAGIPGGGSYAPYDPTFDWLLGSMVGNTQTGWANDPSTTYVGGTDTLPNSNHPEAAQGTGLGDLNFNGVIDPLESGIQRNHNLNNTGFALIDIDHPTGHGPWSDYDTTDPFDANRLLVPTTDIFGTHLLPGPAANWACFDVYGFYEYWGNPAMTWAGGWPTTDGTAQTDYGLKGSVDIPGWSGSGGGLYTVKVWAFDPLGPDATFETTSPNDDWRMYGMQFDLANIQVPWGGATVVDVYMSNLAKLTGTVRWFDMFGNLRALPWAQVTASSPIDSYPAYATGLGPIGPVAPDSAGTYVMWLAAGSHDVAVSTSEASQVWGSAAPTQNAAFSVVVNDGWVGGGDSQVSPSGTPVPELPVYMVPLGLFAALAASVWLLRKKTFNVPVLTK